MSSPLRFIPDRAKQFTDRHGHPIAVVEVTVRTVQGRFLLKPTPTHTSLILGVLGRTQRLYDFELYGYAFLSNHYSMLVGVRSPQHLGDILCHLNGNIARELGRKEHSDWRHKFWSRRSRCIVLLTEDDQPDRLRYLMANGTKEHLVDRPQRWPGAHCATALCEGRPDSGLWIDRTELRRLRKMANQGHKVSEAPAHISSAPALSPLPCWRDLSDHEHRATIRRMCLEISQDAQAERRVSGAPVLGVTGILRHHPHHRPDEIDTSPAPAVHCKRPTLRQWFLQAYRWFVQAYQAAHEALAKAAAGAATTVAERTADLGFPEGGHPPSRRRWTAG